MLEQESASRQKNSFFHSKTSVPTPAFLSLLPSFSLSLSFLRSLMCVMATGEEKGRCLVSCVEAGRK